MSPLIDLLRRVRSDPSGQEPDRSPGRAERGLLMWLIAVSLSVAPILLKPVLMGDLVLGASRGDASGSVRLLVFLGLTFAAGHVCVYLQQRSLQRLGAVLATALRVRVAEAVRRLELSTIERTPVGHLVTYLTSDVDRICEALTVGVLSGAGETVAALATIGLMLFVDTELTVVVLLPFLLAALGVTVVRRHTRRMYAMVRELGARLNADFDERIKGQEVLRAYGAVERSILEFDVRHLEHRSLSFRLASVESAMDAGVELAGVVAAAVLLVWATAGGAAWSTSLFAELLLFLQCVRQIAEPLAQLSQRFASYQSAAASAARIAEFTGQECSTVSHDCSTLPVSAAKDAVRVEFDASASDALVFRDVYYGYLPGVPVLRGVSFRIRRGETVGLIGSTGSGKSTIVRLVLALQSPDAGQIALFGRPISEYDAERLRATLGVAPQGGALFEGTVLSNIAMGDRSADATRAERALAKVDPGGIVARRTGGLDGAVHAAGANLSLGEAQLINLARVAYRDAPLVILDEATSQLDPATERAVTLGFATALEHRTGLIIAHRPSTLKLVQRVLVLDSGVIAPQRSVALEHDSRENVRQVFTAIRG